MSATEEAPGLTETAGSVGGQAGPPTGGGSFYDSSTSTGQVGLAFKRAMVAVRKLKGRETQRIGQLSYAQYGLLHGLSGRSECSARELAEHTDLSPATVTQMLEHLESAGLVTRTRSDQDRRVVLSVLTERGEEVVAERQRHMEQRWQAALQDLSDDELAAATKVLHRVADVFESMAQDGPQDCGPVADQPR